jgi:hypothetical protein
MGIFYDRQQRTLRVVTESSEPGWVLVTHDAGARPHLCRRIMGEWLTPEELAEVDWSAVVAAQKAA